MSDVIQALLSAVETREIDLGECAEMYTGVKLPVRVNWSRGHKKQRHSLTRELSAIRKDFEARDADDDIEPLNKRADENAASWTEWWAVVLLMGADEVDALRDAMPAPHWEWVTSRIIRIVAEYEVDETKKVLDWPGRSSEEPERTPPTSGTDSVLPAG